MPQQCEFSEFSYGFAFTDERLRNRLVHVAPVFPTLRQENALGYDVKIASFGFIQFKRPETLVGNRSRERSLNMRGDIYRMHLNNHQHRLLLRLSRRNKRFRGARVYYACPSFFTVQTLNSSYKRRTILDSSLFIEASCIGQLPPGRHHVSYNDYTRQKGHFWLFSKPKMLEFPTAPTFDEWVTRTADQPPMTADDLRISLESLRRLAKGTGHVIDSEPPNHSAGASSEKERALVAMARLTRSAFDAELLIIVSTRQS